MANNIETSLKLAYQINSSPTVAVLAVTKFHFSCIALTCQTYFRRYRKSPAESRAERTPEGAGTVAAATEIMTATPTATFAVARDAKIMQDGEVTDVTSISPQQQEIQRRRELVRVLFNDFWSGRVDKPATFADRLDQAEIYPNDRLTACGEYWQLDAKTRNADKTASALLSLVGPSYYSLHCVSLVRLDKEHDTAKGDSERDPSLLQQHSPGL